MVPIAKVFLYQIDWQQQSNRTPFPVHPFTLLTPSPPSWAPPANQLINPLPDLLYLPPPPNLPTNQTTPLPEANILPTKLPHTQAHWVLSFSSPTQCCDMELCGEESGETRELSVSL